MTAAFLDIRFLECSDRGLLSSAISGVMYQSVSYFCGPWIVVAVAFLDMWFHVSSERRFLSSVMSGLLVSRAVWIRELARVSHNIIVSLCLSPSRR